MNTKGLSSELNLPDLIAKPKETVTVEIDPDNVPDNDFDDDMEKARKNIHDLLEKGNEILDSAIGVAEGSDHPRAYEVVGKILEQLIDGNKKLIDIHKQKNDIQGKTVTPQQAQNITNQTVFVGSTAELTRLMKNKNNESTGKSE